MPDASYLTWRKIASNRRNNHSVLVDRYIIFDIFSSILFRLVSVMSFKFVLFIFCWPLLFRLLDLGSLLFLFILFSSRAFGLILSFPLASLVLSSSFFFTRLPNSVVVVVAMILGGETECVPQHVENSLLLWFSFMSFRVPTDFVLLRPLAVYSLILYST